MLCHKSCHVKHLSTHTSYCPNNITVVSHVMYPWYMSCLHLFYPTIPYVIYCIFVTFQQSCHVTDHTNIIQISGCPYNTIVKVKITVLSYVMYTCHKSCIHVTSHVPMSHVMYPCHMSCIHVSCHVFISQSGHFILHVMATSFQDF